MSYSRWFNSYWYTFWEYTDSDKKEDQRLNIDIIKSYTYKEIKKNKKKVLKDIKERCKKNYNKDNQPLKRNWVELECILDEFLEDVDNDERYK